ncbi:MAG TPA: hypothetical protein VN033_13255 [Vulgatibacter sp.]|nr:hypothetical protein [Vulgatibacter sp.]
MGWRMDTRELRRNANQLRRDLGKTLSSLPRYDLDDALDVVGLRRASRPASRFFSGLGLVMGGVVVGVVLGMFVLPRNRRAVREAYQRGGIEGLKGAAMGVMRQPSQPSSTHS